MNQSKGFMHHNSASNYEVGNNYLFKSLIVIHNLWEKIYIFVSIHHPPN
jgi:hypothetical protein